MTKQIGMSTTFTRLTMCDVSSIGYEHEIPCNWVSVDMTNMYEEIKNSHIFVAFDCCSALDYFYRSLQHFSSVGDLQSLD